MCKDRLGDILFKKPLYPHDFGKKNCNPYVKGTQKWKNIGICIASILYIGELLTGYATRKYWVMTFF